MPPLGRLVAVILAAAGHTGSAAHSPYSAPQWRRSWRWTVAPVNNAQRGRRRNLGCRNRTTTLRIGLMDYAPVRWSALLSPATLLVLILFATLLIGIGVVWWRAWKRGGQ